MNPINGQHLNDQELQQYVLQSDHLLPQWNVHLARCPDCQRKVLVYKLLFEGVQQQEKPHFDADLSSLVMSQLESARPPGVLSRVLSGMLLLMIVFWVGIIFQWVGHELGRLFASISSMATYLILTSAAGVLLFLLLALYWDYRDRLKLLTLE